MDAPGVSRELLFKNLHELDLLNRTLGGHAVTLQGIKKLMTDKGKTYHIADIGCGSGDTMRYIARWARLNGYKIKLTGIDMNTDAIDYLVQMSHDYAEINGIASDYRNFIHTNSTFDIVHCSLFCHHLKDAEISALFTWFKQKNIGFVINDLQRNWLAYYCALIFTRILNGSALAKNDGPISVLRGFKRRELKSFLQTADIKNYSIERKRGFRWLVVGTVT